MIEFSFGFIMALTRGILAYKENNNQHDVHDVYLVDFAPGIFSTK
jgi:hypothetical protein